jgi:predicted Zn-dependent peptidase
MNEILGGGELTSRLYNEVRSRQGLAYWVGSSFSEPWDYGLMAAGCQTKNETTGKAIQSILNVIEKMRNEKVDRRELQTAKDAIINSFIFRYGSAHAIVTQKMALEYFGYAPDYLETYTSKISEVTAEDIQRAVQTYFKPGEFIFTVVGNEKHFDVPLSTFGVVKSLDITIKE